VRPPRALQRKADGTPFVVESRATRRGPSITLHDHPHWRTVLKAFVKQGIERGVDGFVINHFYLVDGVASTACGALRTTCASVIGLLNFAGTLVLKTWTSINSRNHRQVPTGNMTPLRLEALRFTCISMKKRV